VSPATKPRERGERARMLVVGSEPRDADRLGTIDDLARELRAGDLLVLNDSATLPALLRGRTSAGDFVEARLAAHVGSSSFRAVLLGAGDTNVRTEDRAAPPLLERGARITFRGSNGSPALVGTIAHVDAKHARLVELEFSERDEAALTDAIFRVGRPIQYAYVEKRLALWDVTSRFASEPWSFEPASAGLTLDWRLLSRLREAGVAIANITHAAGISSTGDETLDARLPFAETSRVTEETAAIVRATKRAGGRVVAVGTTVTRALESAATRDDRILEARDGLTELRIDERHSLGVVDAILTGVHVRGESHHELLHAFQSDARLARACEAAEKAGFRTHELGDTMLVYRA
jgi:S-adenosylmethionine:tRNA ribosyltransferase-isomerase